MGHLDVPNDDILGLPCAAWLKGTAQGPETEVVGGLDLHRGWKAWMCTKAPARRHENKVQNAHDALGLYNRKQVPPCIEKVCFDLACCCPELILSFSKCNGHDTRTPCSAFLTLLSTIQHAGEQKALGTRKRRQVSWDALHCMQEMATQWMCQSIS